ncbi:MAG: hypothetical protein JEZ06_09765 [Anaerolineaceae bacterium]|nr:hypothetical protein [Anaerolineaceae bacterium]
MSYNTFQIEGWNRQDTHLISNHTMNSWYWKGFSRNVVLVFLGQPNSCPVEISEDGKPTTYELSSNTTQEILVHLPLVQPDWVRWITRVSLFLTLANFFLFAIAFLRLVLKQNGENSPSERLPWCPPSDRISLIIIAIGTLIAFYFATQQFGLFLVGDSTSYFSGGRSLAAGEGYIMYDGDHFDWWPPLYATLIGGGFFQKVISVDIYIRCLNAIFYMLTMVGWQMLVLSVFPSMNRLLLTSLGLVVAFSCPILKSYVHMLSEPGFVLAIIWTFVFLFRFLKTRNINDIIAFCLFVELATLFRYIGLTVVLAEVLIIFVFIKGNFLKRCLSAIAVGLFSSLMEIFWIFHNFSVSDSSTGLRTPAVVTFQDNIRLTIETFTNWFAPYQSILMIAFLIIILAFFTYRFIMSFKQFHHFHLMPAKIKIIASIVFFISIYCLYLWISLTIVSNAFIGDRLLAPIFLQCMIVILFFIDQVKWKSLPGGKRVNQSIALTLMIISLAIPGVHNLIDLSRTPISTSYERISLYSLKDDRVLAYLKENPLNDDLLIYSNCPYCLNYSLKYYNVVLYNDANFAREYMQSVQEPFHLIWFSNVDMTLEKPNGVLREEGTYFSKLVPPEDLADRQFSLKTIMKNEDGTIYLVYPH